MKMGKNDWILYAGLILAGGYVVYKLSKPLSETVEQIGGGLGTAFQGTGTGISSAAQGLGTTIKEVSTGVSTPFFIVRTYGEEYSKYLKQYGEEERKGLEEAQPVITQRIIQKEEKKQLKQEKVTEIQRFQTMTTESALKNLRQETTQRKTEYGVNIGQWTQKMFLPTTDVIQERRAVAKKNLQVNIKGITSRITSLFKKKNNKLKN